MGRHAQHLLALHQETRYLLPDCLQRSLIEQKHLVLSVLRCSLLPDLQVPMSRMEPGEDLRQRYAAMEDRLKV